MILKSWMIIIPARMASTRLPNKPLADLRGKTLIIRVAENLSALVNEGARIIIATDDLKIKDICEESGFEVMLTDKSHLSGTDRCNEALQMHNQKNDYPYIMNVQGDEPFVNLDDLRLLAKQFSASDCEMATLAFHSTSESNYADSSCVKVAVNQLQQAAYFSRASIPHRRDKKVQKPLSFWEHIGVYAFKSEKLKEFCELPESQWESEESLEQLRALDHGWKILVTPASQKTLGIDTLKDLELAREKY